MSDNRVIQVHLNNGTIETFYGKLSEVFAQQLKCHQFIQSHVSYVVNYDFVKKKEGDVILMKSGIRIPVSRKYREETKKRLSSFVMSKYG